MNLSNVGLVIIRNLDSFRPDQKTNLLWKTTGYWGDRHKTVYYNSRLHWDRNAKLKANPSLPNGFWVSRQAGRQSIEFPFRSVPQ